jgi:hypothetical protein
VVEGALAAGAGGIAKDAHSDRRLNIPSLAEAGAVGHEAVGVGAAGETGVILATGEAVGATDPAIVDDRVEVPTCTVAPRHPPVATTARQAQPLGPHATLALCSARHTNRLVEEHAHTAAASAVQEFDAS